MYVAVHRSVPPCYSFPFFHARDGPKGELLVSPFTQLVLPDHETPNHNTF